MTLFKNALVIDGTGKAPFKANVLVDGSLIVDVDTSFGNIVNNRSNDHPKDVIALDKTETSLEVDEVLDIDGKILCPGFMDIHAHSELEVLRNPSMYHKTQQGITFDLSGNCGIGVYPRKKEDTPVFADILGHYPQPWTWTDFSTYARSIDDSRHPGINMGFLQSHSMLRMSTIKGNPNRVANDKEIAQMRELLSLSMQQGCFGLSTGLYYAPCLFADEKEIVSLLEEVKKNDGIFAVHHRCEGDEILCSIDEILGYVEKTEVKLEISHLKAIGRTNQSKVDAVLEKIHCFQDKGFDVQFDQYPYEYGSTSLFSLLPPFLLRLNKDELSKTLATMEDNISLRKKTIDEILHPHGWDSIVELCTWDDIKIVSLESSPAFDGLTLSEAAKKLGKDPFDALFMLLSKEQELALMADITQSTDTLRKIFKDPLMLFGTDSLYTGDFSHPRSANAAIHLIETMCLKNNVASLPETISKMTSKVASRLGILDRGIIKKGNKADLVVFDSRTLHDNSSLKNPFAMCTGLDFVMVNGTFAVYKNAPTYSRSGSVIKKM